MTARLAFSYGREVYALPGRVDDIRSQGCNRLIREKIAEPLTSTHELTSSLGFKPIHSRKSEESDLQILEKVYASGTSGDKISQIVILPIPKVELEVVAELDDTERGDGRMGSTGR